MTKKDRRTRRIWLNTLATLGSATLVIIYMINIGFNPPSPAKNTHSPSTQPADKIATNLQLTRFTANGKIDHTLVTDRAEFFKEEPESSETDNETDDSFILPTRGQPQTTEHDYAHIVHPQIEVYNEAGQQTHITADHGTYFPAKQLVELEKNVVANDEDSRSLLTTESLSVDTAQKQVLTHDHVTLTYPSSRTTATGLQGNLTQQHWHLLDNVKSVVDTNLSAKNPK